MIRSVVSGVLLGVAAAAAVALWCVVLGAEKAYESLEKKGAQ